MDSRTRQCQWCGRTLPLGDFPLKYPSRAHAKICGECLKLGHSVNRVERKPREELTPEEKKAKRREYMKAYRKRNAERLKAQKRESYRRKAAMVRTYTCVVCGRELPQEMFLVSNGRRRHGGKCNDCLAAGLRMPRAANGKGSRHEYSKKYYSQHKEEIKARQVLGASRETYVAKPRPVKVERPRLCLQCVRYPCFAGIENLESDFAREGCHAYHKRDEVS